MTAQLELVVLDYEVRCRSSFDPELSSDLDFDRIQPIPQLMNRCFKKPSNDCTVIDRYQLCLSIESASIELQVIQLLPHPISLTLVRRSLPEATGLEGETARQRSGIIRLSVAVLPQRPRQANSRPVTVLPRSRDCKSSKLEITHMCMHRRVAQQDRRPAAFQYRVRSRLDRQKCLGFHEASSARRETTAEH